jgi:hypothetical protein
MAIIRNALRRWCFWRQVRSVERLLATARAEAEIGALTRLQGSL